MTPFTASADAVLVTLRVTPGAGRAEVGPVVLEADGSTVVRARVTAVAEDGKANTALRKLLGKEWRVAPSDIDVVRGSTGRRKTVRIACNPSDLLPRLAEWEKSHRD